jgi:hypothetical protein
MRAKRKFRDIELAVPKCSLKQFLRRPVDEVDLATVDGGLTVDQCPGAIRELTCKRKFKHTNMQLMTDGTNPRRQPMDSPINANHTTYNFALRNNKRKLSHIDQFGK